MADEKIVHPAWPEPGTKSGDHLYGGWMAKNRTTVYRTCVHPDCKHVEEHQVPK